MRPTTFAPRRRPHALWVTHRNRRSRFVHLADNGIQKTWRAWIRATRAHRLKRRLCVAR